MLWIMYENKKNPFEQKFAQLKVFCQFLGPETNRMCQSLCPETVIMDER